MRSDNIPPTPEGMQSWTTVQRGAPPARWKEPERTQRAFCRWALVYVIYVSRVQLSWLFFLHFLYIFLLLLLPLPILILPLSGELILLTDPAEVITPPSHPSSRGPNNGGNNDAAVAGDGAMATMMSECYCCITTAPILLLLPP